MIGTIEVQDANQSVTIEDAYDELMSTMQEVRTHIQTARTLLWSAKQELIDGTRNSSFDAINQADANLWKALTAWEEER
jgi:uncharacterized protein